MAAKESNTTLVFIKGARILTYLVYGYSLLASAFLGIGFFLLLFSANSTTPFVKFMYETCNVFIAPFRGIFPLKPVGETGYFSASALFAILMYLLFALALHALINYLTAKMVESQKKLDKSVAEYIEVV
jgi:hypothetical protein